MIDPVNEFQIPGEWVDRVNMPPHELAEGVASGILVVLSNGKVLHRGFTTGTTAAAAAKASVLSLKGDVNSVWVPTPSGLRAHLEVTAASGRAEVVKISGDHKSDATGGLVFRAEATQSLTIELMAGSGIGTVTRGGLQVGVGEPAINPAPRCQILDAIQEALDETGLEGAAVTLSVPNGEAVGAKTLNPRLGVKGGISILGTTGFVEPWSDHLGETKMDLIRDASRVVLTTGRVGMRYSQMLFPDYTVVMVGNRIDEGIKVSGGKTVMCGLPGLILKWAIPDVLNGTGFNTIQEMLENDPTNPIIDRALEAAVKKAGGARIVLLDRDGGIVRDTEGMS
ncbi:MAG: cobalt-precorrin-5B (C(1))-methyltransferase [ANME-2 cluster archaeon]|nr:cobalt-precorrin-5B (C(1))-methyltransferase [ANME-2 cluster archaeon]MDF1557740.1 cobalt-precorrin-5B (C(1))-methyltransferase [ANME-2 cluster archaeon]